MLIIGHRGARALAPENTLRAIRMGMRCADLVEIDIRNTRDGIPVVMHDTMVDRTTDGRGMVSSFSLAEIKKLDAGEGESVPTLSEAIAMARGNSGLVIEFKEESGVEAVVAEASKAGISPLWFVSFLEATLCRARMSSSDIKTGLIYSRLPADPVKTARAVVADAILPKFGIFDNSLVAQAHAADLAVIAWTLNSVDQIREADSMGLDGIASDDPCMARSVLAR